MDRLEATVSGRVQGVGFRRYVQRWARKLDLAGWVRNEPDGTVRLVAEGDAEALDRLTRLLWGGPPPADVASVDAERGKATGSFDGFDVRYER
ncbi:acylphosphatase [Rubrivirga marina]|uniref:Acylphosphatase n=1 Tax=Rubrivirga marina TaxID=1196024 RepID=A0A271J2S2_9BACT|nr:acylphosphatase [Rubrivirga marina]PAP77009.1 hypothetical protein BSZ37_11470 [Rubrivirga marina]